MLTGESPAKRTVLPHSFSSAIQAGTLAFSKAILGVLAVKLNWEKLQAFAFTGLIPMEPKTAVAESAPFEKELFL